MTALPLFPTTLVGSYPQPDWLIDRAKLAGRFPPRVRARELWRPGRRAPGPGPGRRDACSRSGRRRHAGLDVITDGEIRRESYSNHFATALDGVDIDNPGEALDRSGHPNPVPRVVGPIRRPGPIQRRGPGVPQGPHRPHRSRSPCPGRSRCPSRPRTTSTATRARSRWPTPRPATRRCRDLFAAGADIVQLDEPYMQARPEPAREYGLEALNRALDGVAGTTAVHICFGYAAIIHDRPSGYSFLPELADCPCDQVSIETAQSGPGHVGAQAPAGQDDHARRARPVRPRRRAARRSSSSGPGAGSSTSTPTGWCSLRTAA